MCFEWEKDHRRNAGEGRQAHPSDTKNQASDENAHWANRMYCDAISGDLGSMLFLLKSVVAIVYAWEKTKFWGEASVMLGKVRYDRWVLCWKLKKMYVFSVASKTIGAWDTKRDTSICEWFVGIALAGNYGFGMCFRYEFYLLLEFSKRINLKL